MKTFRKALSVMLCLCMIMSAMAVGLNVFAQEKSEAVERFEANVKAFTGDVGKAEPSAEDLEAYEKPVAEYKALGNSDKESVDVMVFDVFYHHVVMRERQISIKNHPRDFELEERSLYQRCGSGCCHARLCPGVYRQRR